jgi:predicted LPLAT superfamily acyltransferase
LWLLYNALIQTLKAKQETVKIVSYVLAVLLVIFMLGTMATRRAANRYLQDFNSQTQELLK